MIQPADRNRLDQVPLESAVEASGPGPAEKAQAKLCASPYAALRRLACDSHEGVLAIRGQVSTFYLKQLAQATVQDVPGISTVDNLVQVGSLGLREFGNSD